MSTYKTTELGNLNEIVNLENGKVFLHDALGLTGCEISIYLCASEKQFS